MTTRNPAFHADLHTIATATATARVIALDRAPAAA
jgi:hypothetical protein